MTYHQFIQNQTTIAKKIDKEENVVKILTLELCNFSSNELYLNYNNIISSENQERILKALDMYFYQNVPVQYILGYTYFYGLKLFVNKDVLIPRPETELLIEMVLKTIENFESPKIIDIGCGSGAIALALKSQLPDAQVTAVDISPKAIAIAKKNARMNNLDIELVESDLFSNVRGKYDILVSNPPYIAYNEEVDSIVLENEPHSALFSSNNGLYHYQEIMKVSSDFLNVPSLIAFEIPYNKDRELMELTKKYYPNQPFEIIKDLNNKSRILIVKNYWR